MATHSFAHTYRVDKNPNSDTAGKRIYSGSECRNNGCRERATFSSIPKVIG